MGGGINNGGVAEQADIQQARQSRGSAGQPLFLCCMRGVRRIAEDGWS